jgi:hypothetical protein
VPGFFEKLCGKLSDSGRVVPIRFLDPKGNCSAEATVGRDIAVEAYRRIADPLTSSLYVLVVDEAGVETKHFVPRAIWEQAQAAFAGIDEVGAAGASRWQEMLSNATKPR